MAQAILPAAVKISLNYGAVRHPVFLYVNVGFYFKAGSADDSYINNPSEFDL